MAAKCLMIQGTGSGVGKSILTAAFCRRFHLDGKRVAPYKAQNMSLNSFVTEDGGEIGRAQAYQAEACGIKPRTEMNPVLLKPSGDNMSQVIVMGRPRENRDAKNYYARRGPYQEEARRALDTLRNEFDIVVMEGAGSPAEINLKEFDFVNMRPARWADAPVLLVGDIDRGGVFAWMKGTFDLLDEEDRSRVGGFIINKFRGDVDLLLPGIRMFEDMVQRPVLGVIPFRLDLYVDEEDAIPAMESPGKSANPLDVAVIRFPRIANFTDVAPLAHDPDVSLRYVWRPEQLGRPDLIILPGSKNTLDDLAFIHEQGLARTIADCRKSGSVILGICGGFQMMGRTVRDPHHVESRRDGVRGLELFEMDTLFQPDKVTRQVVRSTCAGPAFPAGLNIEGYEIHMGISRAETAYPALFDGGAGDCPTGICDDRGSILGTYLHGFLDRDEIREAFLGHVRRIRNLPPGEGRFSYGEFRRIQLDRLAELVDHHVDMARIRRMME